MSVQSVLARPLRFDADWGLRNASRRWTEKHVVLVFVQSTDGAWGVGECWAEPGFPDRLPGLLNETLVPEILHRSPEDGRAILARHAAENGDGRDRLLMSGVSGLDCALWDLEARIKGRPLAAVLGNGADRVYCYGSGGLYRDDETPEHAAAVARDYVDAGFNAVKIKVGGVPLPEDTDRVAAVREAIGPGVQLMLDANGVMSPDGAIAFAEAVEPFAITWFEEPLPLSRASELPSLSKSVSIPLCGNEGEAGRDRVLALVNGGGVGYLQIDLSICGGITAALDFLETAKERHRPVTLHSASSLVLYLASLHLAAAAVPSPSVEHHMVHRWLFDRLDAERLSADQGWVRLPAEPGLGIDLKADDLH